MTTSMQSLNEFFNDAVIESTANSLIEHKQNIDNALRLAKKLGNRKHINRLNTRKGNLLRLVDKALAKNMEFLETYHFCDEHPDDYITKKLEYHLGVQAILVHHFGWRKYA